MVSERAGALPPARPHPSLAVKKYAVFAACARSTCSLCKVVAFVVHCACCGHEKQAEASGRQTCVCADGSRRYM